MIEQEVCFVVWSVIAAVILAAFCLYRLLPALGRWHNPELADAALKQQQAYLGGKRLVLLQKKYTFWQTNKQELLLKAGYSNRLAFRAYLIVQIGLSSLVFLLALAGGAGLLPAGAAAALMAVIVEYLLGKKAARNKEKLSQSLYKIYRFLDGQITAGISVPDALRGLPQAVRNPLVRKSLEQFVAIFEMTLDLEQAVICLEKIFESSDYDLLAAHIHQCLASGIAGKGLIRTEELLFSRAFAQMQAETSGIRSRLVLIAAAALSLLMIIFLYPLLHGAFLAVQTIFG